MRFYHAFMPSRTENARIFEACGDKPPKHVLFSWHYLGSIEKGRETFKQARDAGVERLFLDCGAFSAHTKGATINLPEYERAIELLQPDVYVALDVIGDAIATKANLERMLADGFEPVPVFTRGAPFAELRELVARFPYIALGNISSGRGTVAASAEHLRAVFATAGPGVRFHAFGLTAVDIMRTFPLYSVDSSVAIKSAMNGIARVPKGGKVGYAKVNHDPKAAWDYPHLTDYLHGSREGAKQRWARIATSIAAFDEFAEQTTRLWAERGVVFEEDQVGRAA